LIWRAVSIFPPGVIAFIGRAPLRAFYTRSARREAPSG